MAKTGRSPFYHVMKHDAYPHGYRVVSHITQEIFDSAVDYKAQDDDTFVVSYPKNGTTWLMNIMYLMQHDGRPLAEGDKLDFHIPFLEFDGGTAVDKFQRPRIIKSHLYWDMLPQNPNAKYVFVARNPKDCMVSFYHHTVGFEDYYRFSDGSFDDFFEVFIEGGCDSGDYFELVPQWHAKSLQQKNIHFVLYEDMKNDIQGEILKLADFLGAGLRENLTKDNCRLLKDVVEHSSFTKMKKDSSRFCIEERPGEIPFIRKGVIGDWRNVLSREQSQRINAKLEESGDKYPGFNKIWTKYDNLLK